MYMCVYLLVEKCAINFISNSTYKTEEIDLHMPFETVANVLDMRWIW